LSLNLQNAVRRPFQLFMLPTKLCYYKKSFIFIYIVFPQHFSNSIITVIYITVIITVIQDSKYWKTTSDFEENYYLV